MSNIKIKIDKSTELALPQLPNFIREAREGGNSWPIHHLTNAELKAIGEIWTRHLIMLAEKRRKNDQ